MATSGEPTDKVETRDPVESPMRSITDRFSMGSLVAASRLMSCLSKQTRHGVSKRNYTVSAANNDKGSILKPLTKRISLTRHRSSSPSSTSNSNSPPFKPSSAMRNSTTIPSHLGRESKTVITPITPSTPTPDTLGFDFNFESTYTQLRELAETNCKYFAKQQTDVCQRFERLLHHLLQSIDASMPLVRYLTENFHHFDYSTEVRPTPVNDLSFLIRALNRFEPMVIGLWSWYTGKHPCKPWIFFDKWIPNVSVFYSIWCIHHGCSKIWSHGRRPFLPCSIC